MRKLLTGIIIGVLTVQTFAGPVTARAAGETSAALEAAAENESETDGINGDLAQQNAADTEESIKRSSDDESMYPQEWDEEDPQNARAYEQLYGTSGEEPLLYSALSDGGVKTTWGTTTYTHNNFNTDGKKIMVGIDVSYHNGVIDWNKVKASGIQFAILRVGYRAYVSGSIGADSKFRTYITDAQKAGIKVGVYFFPRPLMRRKL